MVIQELLRRRPDARWNWSEEKLAALVQLQLEILERAAKICADGGVIVYSTCSNEPEENQKDFLKWLYDFEYDKLGLPCPDLIIYLDVPTDFTEAMMRRREADTNTHADIHEQDLEYLATCRRIGKAAAAYYGWTVINCVRDDRMRSIEDIQNEIYSHVMACLED